MCDQHGFSTSGQLAAMFPSSTANGNAGSVADVQPPPVRSADVAVAAASREPSDIVTAADTGDEPKKKRGFWGRIFGRGDKDKKGDEPLNNGDSISS